MEPPSFPTNGPRAVRTAPGDDTVLVLPLPSGSPPFQFEWSRAGAKLGDRFTSSNDAGGVRLTVSAARTSDSGVYTLQASNAAGKDTTRVRLEVSPEEMATGEDPPNFLRRLQDLTVKVGTRTRFLVEIVSSTECRVTWYRNERRLLEAERIALVRDGNFWCADISAVSVDDAGRWTCTAENVGGRASCSAHLNVLVPKAYKRPEFVEELRALLTEQGTVSLECKVVGVPTPVLRWFKDSREIKAGDVFALTANAEDPTSLGTYTCEAVNCMGRAYSSSKVHVVGRASREGSTRPTSDGVTPEPPPIFTKELEDHFVRICEPLTMSCNLVVPPWPRSVVWYNKEGKIEGSERYHILEDGVGGYLLEVPSAEWPDEGEWKCVATSAGGRVGISTCYVSMDVPKNYRKPRFMENLQAVLTEEGLVSFECKVVGFPTPVLSWFKDGQELKPGDVYQLTGTNSLGSYCCIARNCMGQASSSAELTVEDIQNQLNEEEKLQLFSKNQAPKFLQGLKSVEAKIDEPFRFTIKVAIPPEPTVLWYRDDQPVDESSRCHHGKEGRGVSFLDIQNLEFMDQAEWKCVAMNDYGHSITSCFLKLIIPRHYKKPRFLENLQAILSDEGAVNLECKVIGVPQPVLKWYKDGEELKPGDIHKIISGQDGTCCLGTYTCEAQNCMGIAASSASLLGFEDSMKLKNKKKADEQQLQRNLSLSTIHEERTSQMYDTPVGDITLDERGEISFSFDGKEVSVSLYETPDLTEEEALQIVEMYADQLSENVTEHNVVELPPLRFVKETSTSGNLLMEAIIIDVSPEYFTSPEEDLRTEADIEDISIADENGPPQLSLDQDVDGDYLEKTIAIMSEEKADIPKKLDRKKSDSQKSGDDYFSLSRDQSISDEKKDDDTQPLSESELQSFASARSSGKPKSKSSKPSVDDGQESSEITKTVLLVEDLQKPNVEGDNTVPKNIQQRRRSRSSRRSSSGSEKSLNKLKENVIEVKLETEDITKDVFINQEIIKSDLTRINSSITKVINDIQIVERDTILKSELMSTTATASRSLEIINSLLTPISEINCITKAISEMMNEPSQVIIPMFNRLHQPLENLLKSLTIVGKCIDVESENKTLVKKTSVSIIERCGSDLDFLIKEIQTIHKEFLSAENVEASTLENISTKLISNINDLINIVNKDKNQNGEMDNDVSEKAKEFNHLQNTQKAMYGLKSSLKSLLDIVNEVDIFKPCRLNKVKEIDIILNDMSMPIHDLQTALEHIEGLSIQETKSNLHKYNTEIIDSIMDSILQLRTSFKELSGEVAEKESIDDLNQILIAIKLNINKLFLHIDDLELKIGKFDILNSDNKMEVLQKMAQILITLENNLPLLETIPSIKSHMSEFHKNLTKILENVIESDDREKYFCLLEICEAIKRINSSIKCIDSSSEISLANLRNTLKIVKEHINKNIFQQDLNQATSSIITSVLVSIDSIYNRPEEMTTDGLNLETVQDLIIIKDTESKVNIILEHIEQTIAAWSSVTPQETAKELIIIETLNKICPILEDLKLSISNTIQEAEKYDKASDLDSLSYTESIAVQLCELNQTVNVLSHIFYENTDDQERSQLIGEYGKPLLELSTALQILQQDIISQCKENESYLNISSTIANVLESLQSCIVVQEQQFIEAADDMSTLEDISGIKSTAEIISSSDVFATATVEETISKEFTKQFSQLLSSTSLQTLQQINNHIMSLKNPDVLEVLDLVPNLNDYSIAKSIFTELKPIISHIQEVYETSDDIPPVITTTLISEIVQPLEELEQKLSVIDISNITSLENMPENSKEKLCHMADNILSLKNNIRESLDIVKPTTEFADFMIVVSNKISNLRVKSEKLIYFADQMMTKVSNTSNDNLMKLKHSLSNFLKSTNYPFEIKIPQIKEDIKNLYNALIIGQDELTTFTVPKSECLAEEATIIDMIDDIEDTILTLHEYGFVDLSQNLHSSYATKPLNVIEVKTNLIFQVNYDIENTLKNIKNLSQDLLNDQIIFVEDFCETFKNEMTILRALIKKPSSSKRLIKLLQVFFNLSNQFKDFKNRQETGIPENINKCLNIFIVDTEECLTHLQLLLLEAIENKFHVLFDTPVSNINNIEASLAIILQSSDKLRLHSLINKFLNIVRAIQPCFENLQSSVIKELYLSPIRDSECTSVEVKAYKEYEIFTSFILEELNNIMRDDDQKDIYKQILNVVRKHENYERAIGSGKILIFINCISDCSEIFKGKLEMISKAEELRENSGEGTLRMNIADVNNYLENLYIKLQEIQKHHLTYTEKAVVPLEIKSIEQIDEISRYLEKTMDCDILSLNNSDISMLMELDNKLHLIRKTLSCLESTSSFENIKVLFDPIEEMGRILNKLLDSGNLLEEKNRILKEKTKSLLQHMEQYIEIIEIVEEVSAVIKFDDLKESANIVRELRQSIEISEKIDINDPSLEKRHLTQKLQKALISLQSQGFENLQEFAPSINEDVRQQIIEVVTDLQNDLDALTGTNIFVEENVPTLLLKREQENVDEDVFEKDNITPDKFVNPPELEKHPYDSQNEIENKTTIVNDKDPSHINESQSNLNEIEQNVGNPITMLNASVIKEETSCADMLEEAHNINENISLHMNSKDADSLTLMSDKSHETIKDTPHKKSIAITDVLLNHLEKYISDDVVSTIKKLSPPLRSEHLEYTIKVAKQLLDCTDTTTAEDSSLQTGLSSFSSEQFELALSMYESLSIMFKTIFDQSIDFEDLIGKDEFDNVKTAVNNLRATLQIIIASVKTSLDVEISTDIQKQDLDVREHEEEKKPQEAGVSTFTYDEIIYSEVQNLPTSEIIITGESKITADTIVNEYAENLIEIKISKAEEFSINKLSETNADQKSTLDNVIITETPVVSCIDGKKIQREKIDKDTLLDQLNEYIREETLKAFENLSPPLNLENINESIQTARQLHEATILEEIGDLHLSKTQLHLALKLEKIISPISEIVCVENTVFNEVSEYEQIKKSQATISNLHETLKTLITLTQFQVDEQLLDLEEVKVLGTQGPVDDQLIINEEKLDLIPPAQVPTENVYQGDAISDLLERENTENYILGSKSNLNERNNNNIMEEIVTTSIIEDLKDITSVLQPSDEDNLNSLEKLLKLFQDASNTIDLSSETLCVDSSENLQNTLDEVQTVIMELKSECVGSIKDAFNETLEDLECNVRSVLLQINEHSPSIQLKEACANLQSVAAYLCEIGDTVNIEISKSSNTLCDCTNDVENTIELLETASNIKGGKTMESIISNLNNIKDTMKFLRSSFLSDAETLILRGIEVIQSLDNIEDRIFCLEKDIEAQKDIDPITRDSIISAVHSVYGSISNMRGAVSSIQKKYMYENYGNPSRKFLQSIKNSMTISKYDNNKFWKDCAKAIRKVLNHFEDIKFYINLDKTARLPSDAAFTKIILTELYTMVSGVNQLHISHLDKDVSKRVQNCLDSVNEHLTALENRTTLEVKDKIPIFKKVSEYILDFTHFLKNIIEKEATKDSGGSDNILDIDSNNLNAKLNIVDLDHSVSNDTQIVHDIELNEEKRNEITKIEKKLDQTTEAVIDVPQEDNHLKNISITETVLESNEILQKQETPILKNEQEIRLDIKVDENDRKIEKEISGDKLDSRVTESVDSEDRISPVYNKEIKDTENIKEKDINQNTKLIHENISDKKEEVDETSAHRNNEMDSCNVEIIGQGSLHYTNNKNEINNRDLEFKSQKEDDNKLNEQDVLENEIERANNEITEKERNDSTKLERKSIEKKGESTVIELDQRKSVNIDSKIDKEVENCIKLEENALELKKPMEKQEESKLKLEEQYIDELEPKEESKVEIPKSIEKYEESKFKSDDQHKDELLEIKGKSKEEITKSIEEREESKLQVEDQYKDEKLEIKEDGKVETEKSIRKQDESEIKLEDRYKDEELEMKDDNKVDITKFENQKEESKDKLDKHKVKELEIKEDKKGEKAKSIGKQKESKLKGEDQYKDEMLEIKEDDKVEIEKSIEMQEESKLKLEDQHKDEVPEIKDDGKVEMSKSVEKGEESELKLEQHQNEKFEMKEGSKLMSTNSIDKQEESKHKLKDQDQQKLEIKEDGKLETEKSIKNLVETKLKLEDKQKDEVLEMKDDKKIEIAETIEKQEESKCKLEDQVKKKLEIKEGDKEETEKSVKQQEESKLIVEDQYKDENLEMKDDSKVKLITLIEEEEKTTHKLEDQHNDEILEIKEDSIRENVKIIEKRAESKLTVEDQYIDEKFEMKDDSKVELITSIEKLEQTRLKLEDQHKDEKLETKDDSKEKLTTSIEKQGETTFKLEDQHKDEKLEMKHDSKEKLTTSIEKQEETTLKFEDQYKDEKLETKDDNIEKLTTSIEKQEETTLKFEDQYKDEKLETKDCNKEKLTITIEKQEETTLKLEDQHEDENLETKHDRKEKVTTSIEKQEETTLKIEDQHKDEKLETKHDRKEKLTTSIEKYEESKFKSDDQHKDEMLEIKEDGKVETEKSIRKQDESEIKLEDRYKHEELEMKDDNKVDITKFENQKEESKDKLDKHKVKELEIKEDKKGEKAKSIEKQKESKHKGEDQYKDEMLEIKEDDKVEIEKSIEMQEESKLKLEDQHKDEVPEIKDDGKVEMSKSVEKGEVSELKLEDQHEDENLETKHDRKEKVTTSIEKQEETTLKIEDQHKDEKLETKDDSKEKLTASIEKLEQTRLKLEDQHKDEKLETKDDSKEKLTTSIEKQEETTIKLEDQHKDEKLETKHDKKEKLTTSIEKLEETTLKLEDQHKDEKLETKHNNKEKVTTSIDKLEETTLKLEDQHKDEKLETKDDNKEKLTTSIEKQEETTIKLEDQHKDEKLETKHDRKEKLTTSIEKQEETTLKLEDQHRDEKLEKKHDRKEKVTTSIEKQEETTLKIEDQHKDEKFETKDDSKGKLTITIEKQEETTLKLEDQHEDENLETKHDRKEKVTTSIEKQEETTLKIEDQHKDKKLETKDDSKEKVTMSIENQEETTIKLKDQHKDEKLETKDDNKEKLTTSIEKQEETTLKIEDQHKDEKLESKHDKKEKLTTSIEKLEETTLKLEDQHKDEKLETKHNNKEKVTTSIEKLEETTLKLEDQHKDEKLETKDDNKEKLTTSIEKQEETTIKLEDQHKDEKLETKHDRKEKLTTSIEQQEETTLKLEDQQRDEKLEKKHDRKEMLTTLIEKQEETTLKLEDQHKDEKLEMKDDSKEKLTTSIEKQKENKLISDEQYKDEKLGIKEENKGDVSKSIKEQEDINLKSENQNKDKKLETKEDSKIETPKSIKMEEESKPKLGDQQKENMLDKKKDSKEEISKLIEKQEESELKLEDIHKDKKLGERIEVKEQKLAQLKNKTEESGIVQDKPFELNNIVKQEKESKLDLEDEHKDENLEMKDQIDDQQLEKLILKEEEDKHNNKVETFQDKQKTEKSQSKKSHQKRMGKNNEKTKIDGGITGQPENLLEEIEKEQVNETAKLGSQSKDLAESNIKTPKEINKKEIATKQEGEKIEEITHAEEYIHMDEKRILSDKSINQEANLLKGKNIYQKELKIRENQNTEKFDVTIEKQFTTEKGTLCEENYSRHPEKDEKIKTILSAENIMNKRNEKEVRSKQTMQNKVNSEFIECTKPDYSLEFTKPPTYISKTFDVEDTVSQIKTNNKIPTMYKVQTLLYESQLRSSLPPYQRLSEGRTEMKDITKAISETRNTLSEKRTGVARDSKRKPVFSTYLTDRTAVESSRVKLTCSILSASQPTITWYKNGSVLDNKQKFRSKFVDGLITLEVLNAIPSDSGEYSCTVQNENGSITSSANLKVYPSFEASPIPPTFTRSIRDTYHLADNELVLECRIRGQPLPAITWLKNNESIILNERIQSHYLADGVCRLTISSPTSGDSGNYTCKAENSVWSDQISHDVYFAGAESRVCPRLGAIEKIHLNRQAIESRRPHFTNVLTDHRVVSGGTIGLQVEIRGDPTRVEWLREGRSVTELYRNAQTYVEHDIYTLALTDVTEKESGLYTCRAWSSHGNIDMNASITVVQPNLIEGKPATIVSRPAKDLLISVGEDINISFRVRGEPKPKVFFMKGIRDITNSLRVCKMTSDDYVKFTLKRSVISDAGTYCIFARNAYGCDRAFVTVVVRQRASSDSLISDWMYPMDDLAISSMERNYKSVPDRIPSEPSVVDGGNNWISLAWSKPDTLTKAPILAYKIECWMLGKEGGARWTELGITPRNSFDAFNLKQGEEYHFRVTPRNRYGWGESVQTSAPIGIGLAGDRPEFTEILPGQLKVLLGESAVLGCSFKGKPTPEIVWMKNGHEIEEERNRITIVIDDLNTSLHINEVKIEDEGRYSCEATNIHGRSSTYARMAVISDRHIWEADAKLKRERSAGIDGEYPPQFTMRLRDRRVQATYPVRLTCQIVGNPPPILTWFKDGKEISSDGRHITTQDECFHTLEIAPTTLEDGGVYEAMARNCYGAISCRCSLVVDKGIRAYIAPEFCCGLEPLYHLSEGDELRISAVVEAYPSVGVTWYRDGVRLRPSRRAIMTLDRDGQIELALASVTSRDAGVYTCTASNEVGRASTSGKVEVVSEGNIVEKTSVPPIVISPDVPYSKEPLFIRKPRSSEAHEGDTVIIECEVIGDPKPDVYWLRDFLKPDYYRDASHFRRVGAGPAYRFEIPHAKFDYTGAYSIIAKNIHGEAKAIISLQILAKDPSAVDDAHNIRFGRVEVIPHIDKELTDLLCYDGDAVEFDCRVSGNPEPDIRWFHYNEIVTDCPDFEASYDLGIARLKIKQVTAEDEGTYSCEASNSMGKVTSSACLVVYPPGEPNTLSQQLRRPTGLLSAASTPRSTPRSTPARSKSRTPGPDLRRLRSPTREVAPKFYTYPYNKVAEEGDTIVFQCAVKGLPPPWATWDKDGIIITPSARFNIKEKDETFKILEIEQVTIEDVGLYRITLENDYGRTEASARLEVITQKGKFYGTTRSYSVSPRKSLSYRRRTPSFSKQD